MLSHIDFFIFICFLQSGLCAFVGFVKPAAGERGAVGPPGQAGERGEQGVIGRVGAKGDRGSPGIGTLGPVGPPGQMGDRGDPGVRGPPGDQSLPGSSGPQGEPGIQGSDGPRGVRGPPGNDGTQGIIGTPGLNGAAGVNGLPGTHGTPGAVGLSGPVGPPGLPGMPGLHGVIGLPGLPGVIGLPGLPGDLLGWSSTKLPGDVERLPGTDGPMGRRGPSSNTGRPGRSGSLGPDGPAGESVGLDVAALQAFMEPGPDKGPAPQNGSVQSARTFGKDLTDEGRHVILERAYTQLQQKLKQLVQQDGTRESPARTCRDLAAAYPDKPNGDYWIDPNASDKLDAILVYCDIQKRMTCLTPEPASLPEMAASGRSGDHQWLSEDIPGGDEFSYNADATQIGFLQLLSTKAEQSLVYHCINHAAVYNLRRQTDRGSLRLSGWDELDIYSRGKNSYTVISDGCQNASTSWERTEIKVSAKRAKKLPLIDIGLHSIGEPEQKFKIELGQACFY